MRRFWVIAVCLVGFVLTFVAAVAWGSVEVAWTDALAALLAKAGLGDAPDPITTQIIWSLRVPRLLLAYAVGGGLAVVGVGMQALVRNPLAEPYILGVSSGASMGATLFYLGFLPPLVSKALSMPLAAFAGALLAMTVVFLVARSNGALQTTRLLLAGVAVAALFTAVSAFVLLASPDPQKVQAVLFWTQGSLSGARWAVLGVPMAASVAGLIVLWALARPLDALLLGEEEAQSLGVRVSALQRGLVLLTAVVTGALVSSSGIIGFVGLIVPHAVRAVVGVAHRRVVPLSFVVGALFLAWADLAARSLLVTELPIGVLTALCGVPFFLYLLRSRPYGFGT